MAEQNNNEENRRAVNAERVYCPKCGSPVADDANFCAKCGLELSMPEEEAPAEPVPVVEDDTAKKYGSGGGGRIIVVVLLIVMGLIAMSKCNSSSSPTTGKTYSKPTANGLITVRYELFGTADSASITYSNDTGATVQNTNAKVPQKFGFDAQPGQFVYLSAQSNSIGETIGCVIYADGVVVQKAESEGTYAIATCSGSVR